MNLAANLKTLYHLALAPVAGETHTERLESFYRSQANSYDDFRQRLLHGRRELYEALPVPAGGVWVEMGGGTGFNLQYLGDRIHALREVLIVDLSHSLLEVAERRIREQNWTNVATRNADATTFCREGAADVVTFSYSLTMIPDWFAAIDQALSILKPGGVLGVVDFYVSRKHPSPRRARHGWGTRHFWPTWFGTDNVHLNPDHLPYLERRLETISVGEGRGRVPFLCGLTVPYYRFIGRKRA